MIDLSERYQTTPTSSLKTSTTLSYGIVLLASKSSHSPLVHPNPSCICSAGDLFRFSIHLILASSPAQVASNLGVWRTGICSIKCDCDVHLRRSLHRWKALGLSFPSVKRSSKMDITMSRYGSLLMSNRSPTFHQRPRVRRSPI